MSHHVSELTQKTGSAWGCIGCGKRWTGDEVDGCQCSKCLGRVRVLVEIEWWEDSTGCHIPTSVIDFSKQGDTK